MSAVFKWTRNRVAKIMAKCERSRWHGRMRGFVPHLLGLTKEPGPVIDVRPRSLALGGGRWLCQRFSVRPPEQGQSAVANPRGGKLGN